MVISNLEDEKIVDINDTFLSKFELTEKMAIGNSLTNLGVIERGDYINLVNKLSSESGVTHNMEFSGTSCLGKKRIGYLSGHIIEIDGEKQLLTVINDLTEIKEHEEKLAKTKHNFLTPYES